MLEPASNIRARAEVHLHNDYVRSVQYVADGRYIVSGAKNGELYVLDAESLEQIMYFSFDRVDLILAGVDPRSGHLLVCGRDNQTDTTFSHMHLLNIFNPASSTIQPYLNAQRYPIKALAFSNSGRYIATGSSIGTVGVYCIATHCTVLRVQLELDDDASVLSSVKFSPDDQVILVACSNDYIHCVKFDQDKVARLGSLGVDRSPPDMYRIGKDAGCSIMTLEFYDSMMLVGGTAEKSRSSRVSTGKIEKGMELYLRVYYDWRELVANDGFNAPRSTVYHTVQKKADDSTGRMVLCVTYSPSSGCFACGTETGHVHGFQLKSAVSKWTQHGHQKHVYCIDHTPASATKQMVASGARDKKIITYDASYGTVLHTIDEFQGWVQSVIFLDNGDLVAGSLDFTVRVYRHDKNYSFANFDRRLYLQESGINCLAVAPRGARKHGLVACGMPDGALNFVDLSMHRHQPTFTEARQLVNFELKTGSHEFLMTKAMVAKYPLVTVNPEITTGETLLHFAVRQYHTVLLKVLLATNGPKFWLPINAKNEDALDLALLDKAIVQMIMDHAIDMKKTNKLAGAFSSLRNKLIVNLMKLSMHYPEVVANFLQRFGLDEVRLSEDLKMHEKARAQLERKTQYTYHHEEGLFFGPHNATLENEGIAQGATESIPSATFWPMQLIRFGKRHKFISQASGGGGGRLTLMPRVAMIPRIAGIVPGVKMTDLSGLTSKKLGKGHGAAAHLDWSNSILHFFLKADSPILFGNDIMRFVIQYKWNTYARKMFMHKFYLFLGFLTAWVWITWAARVPLLLGEVDDSKKRWFKYALIRDDAWNNEPWNAAVCIICVVYCVGFQLNQLRMEFRQMFGHDGPVLERIQSHLIGVDYWSMLQVISAIMSISYCGMLLFVGTTYHHIMQRSLVGAIATFLNWLMLLYYLRPFESTGALVRIVFKVFFRSRHFLGLIFIFLVGAANAMSLLFQTSECLLPDESDVLSCAFPNECNADHGVLPNGSNVSYNRGVYDTDWRGEPPLSCGDVSFLGGSPSDKPRHEFGIPFWDLFFSGFNTFLLGDIELAVGQLNSFQEQWFALSVQVIFMILLLFFNVFLLNLMINLMDDTMAQIHVEEGNALQFEKAKLIQELEASMGPEDVIPDKMLPIWCVFATAVRRGRVEG